MFANTLVLAQAKRFFRDEKAEVDEKAVLMVVLVLGTIGGVTLVATRIFDLLNTAADGL